MRHPLLLPLALLLVTAIAPSALASGVAPGDASPTQREQAQARFSRGHDLFNAKKYAEASVEFDASYGIVASPNALLFLARCDREQGKLVSAFSELGRTAAEAKELAASDPRYAKTAESASAERDALAAQIAFLTVSVDHPSDATRVLIGGESVAHPAWNEPFPVTPGSVEIVVQTPGRPEARATVTLAAGDKKTISVDASPGGTDAEPAALAPSAPQKPAPPSPEEEERSRVRLRTAAWVSGGVGAVGLLTFAVAGLASSSTYSDLQNECHGACPANSGHDSEISRGKTEQTIANIGLVAGILGVGAGVTLFVMSIPKSDTVSLVTGPTWMGVRGTF